jgi:activating signal cointegrator 1
MHKALNNCLHCGRISCEREGYDYCPFCSYMVYEHRSNTIAQSTSSAATTTNIEAWEQKERLLQYDREFAQRTIILDDQADYYNRTTSNWLNDQEQQEAQKQEQERSNAIQSRPRPKMILDI